MRRAMIVLSALLTCSAAYAQSTDTTPLVSAATAQVQGVWAKQAIELVVKKGLVVGYPGEKFNWESAATRKEVAVIFSRLLQKYPLDKLEQMLTKEELKVLQAGLLETQQGLQTLNQQMSEAVSSLKALQAQVDALQVQIGENKDSAAAAGSLDSRLGDLEKQFRAALDVPANFDFGNGTVLPKLVKKDQLAEVTDEQKGLIETLQQDLSTLNSQLDNQSADLSQQIVALQSSLKALQAQLEEGQAGLDTRLKDLDARLAVQEKLAGDVTALTTQNGQLRAELTAQTQKQASTDAKVAELEAYARATQEERARMDAEKAGRASRYVGIAGHFVGSSYSGGTVLRVVGGMDGLWNNFGVRLTGDIPLKSGTGYGMLISAQGTYTVSAGKLDGYIGAGMGYNITQKAIFGDLTVGANYRFNRMLAVFAELRDNYSFKANEHFSSAAVGLQFRF